MSIDVLVVVSQSESQSILVPLLGALQRAGCRFALFFTHAGSKLAAHDEVIALAQAAEAAVVCQESWVQWRDDDSAPCPLEAGSQTDHSHLLGRSARVVSL